MSKKMIISIVSLICSALCLVGSVSAWFISQGGSINNIIISTGSIASEINLYKVADLNNDGIPDIDEANHLTPITDLTTKISFSNLRPSNEIMFLLAITNVGGEVGQLDLFFDKIINDTTTNMLAQVMSINIFTKSIVDGQMVFTRDPTKTKLLVNSDLGQTNLGINAQIAIKQTYEMYFSFKFENLEYLKIHNPAIFAQKTDLNEYMTKSFTMSKMTVRLQQLQTP